MCKMNQAPLAGVALKKRTFVEHLTTKLKNNLHLKPYKIQFNQELQPTDHQDVMCTVIQYCNLVKKMIVFLKNAIMCDGAYFDLAC